MMAKESWLPLWYSDFLPELRSISSRDLSRFHVLHFTSIKVVILSSENKVIITAHEDVIKDIIWYININYKICKKTFITISKMPLDIWKKVYLQKFKCLTDSIENFNVKESCTKKLIITSFMERHINGHIIGCRHINEIWMKSIGEKKMDNCYLINRPEAEDGFCYRYNRSSFL